MVCLSLFRAQPLRLSLLTLCIEADGDLVCQPGVGWVEINDTLKERGEHCDISTF